MAKATKKTSGAKKTQTTSKKTTTSKSSQTKKSNNAKPKATPSVSQATKPTTQAAKPAYSWQKETYQTLQEFWPFYLYEHSSKRNRLLHFIGTTLGLLLFIVALVLGYYWLILLALVSGYAFAWVGHFFIEKNKPATFKYPLKSFLSDWRMWYAILTRRIEGEYKKFNIDTRP